MPLSPKPFQLSSRRGTGQRWHTKHFGAIPTLHAKGVMHLPDESPFGGRKQGGGGRSAILDIDPKTCVVKPFCRGHFQWSLTKNPFVPSLNPSANQPNQMTGSMQHIIEYPDAKKNQQKTCHQIQTSSSSGFRFGCHTNKFLLHSPRASFFFACDTAFLGGQQRFKISARMELQFDPAVYPAAPAWKPVRTRLLLRARTTPLGGLD